MTSAVIFLVFNRPALTKRVFDRIRNAQPPQLFVVADGPRPDRPGEAKKCAEVRRLIEEGVDWPCELVRDYSEVNLGCSKRVSSGITNAFARVEEAIILEDDCLPDPTFFSFCEELLARFRNEDRVAQIAGCSFQPPVEVSDRPSYYFSRYPHCWGWATWRRAWCHYDHEMKTWRTHVGRRLLNRIFKNDDERRWWAINFNNTVKGKIDSWAFRWTLTVFSREWLGVLPYRNLVSNIGFGSDATRTRENGSPLNSIPAASVAFPLRHPNALRRDESADEHTGELHFHYPSITDRAIRRVRALWSR